MRYMRQLEVFIERTLFASRWLLVPIYLGLSLALVALSLKFFQEVWHVLPNIFAISEINLILAVLSLIDIVLIAGLLIMVMLSGYENFVSKLDVETNNDLGWLGKLDANSLKLKVAAAIVAISSIHMLKAFMNIESIPNDKLLWYVVMHLTFVVSALLMGIQDKISQKK
jgi:uncharacterized protein (TIGR00645 family)